MGRRLGGGTPTQVKPVSESAVLGGLVMLGDWERWPGGRRVTRIGPTAPAVTRYQPRTAEKRDGSSDRSTRTPRINFAAWKGVTRMHQNEACPRSIRRHRRFRDDRTVSDACGTRQGRESVLGAASLRASVREVLHL